MHCLRDTHGPLQVVADPGISAGAEDFSALIGDSVSLAAVFVNCCATLDVDTSDAGVTINQLTADADAFKSSFSNILESVTMSNCLLDSGVILVATYEQCTWLVHGERSALSCCGMLGSYCMRA